MVRTRTYPYTSVSDQVDQTFIFKDRQSQFFNISGISYKLNSFGFRSDEFTNIHNGDHILFIGCSVTYGTGMPIEKTWSKLFYDDISKTRAISGYFNLSYPGAASTEIIFNAVKYIKKFGSPKEIYFMIPEIMRGVHLEKSAAILHSIQMYTMFEELCYLKNINLKTFTWDLENISDGYIQTANDFYKNFKTFYSISYKEFSEKIYDYAFKNKKEKFLLLAADEQHIGAAQHYAFYKQLAEIAKG